MNRGDNSPSSMPEEEHAPLIPPEEGNLSPPLPGEDGLPATMSEDILPAGLADEIKVALRRRRWQFATGFLGWYLIFGTIWLLIPEEYNQYGTLNLLLFPINIILLLVLIIRRKTRPIGLGILAALAVNLGISLIIGMIYSGWCFVPFFIDWGW